MIYRDGVRIPGPEEKAQALLKRLVSPEQWDIFCRTLSISVRGYRIHYHYPYLEYPSGRRICITPLRGPSPWAPTDDLLGLYLLIRYDYPRFKRIIRRATGTTLGNFYWTVICLGFLLVWSLFHMPKA